MSSDNRLITILGLIVVSVKIKHPWSRCAYSYHTTTIKALLITDWGKQRTLSTVAVYSPKIVV